MLNIRIKKYKKIIIGCLLVIFLSNIYPFSGLIKMIADGQHYNYSNYNGSNTFIEFWDRNFEMMMRVHKNCLLSRHDLKDKNIYRLFSKNPFAFWRWSAYLFDKRYKLPYKNWKEIEQVRAKEKIRGVTGCTIDF